MHGALREKRVREALLLWRPVCQYILPPTCDGDAKLEAVGGVLGVEVKDGVDVMLVPVIIDTLSGAPHHRQIAFYFCGAVALEDLTFDDSQSQLHLQLQQPLQHFL